MSREFKNYKNENGGTVSAHVVTEETQGSYQTVDGRGAEVSVGSVLVQAGRPDAYDVVDAKSFRENYKEDNSVTHDHDGLGEHTHSDDTVSDDDAEFNPDEHTADEVKAHLASVRGTEEYARVVSAERAGKNRSSALA